MLVHAALGFLLQQPVPIQRLQRPDATLPREFIQVRGVVERPDGRVLIADRLEQFVGVVDFRDGSVTRIGRVGGGPEEYRLPSGLLRVAGDSVLVTDEGNNRLALIGPDLRIRRTFQPATPGLAERIWPRTVDAGGRYYALIPGWVLFGMGQPDDSLPVIRFLPAPAGRTRETIAWLHPAPQPPPPPRRDRPRIPMLVFAAGDAWAADPSGRIAIVRAKDYHVEWIDPSGAKITGPAVAWQPIEVTERDKTEYTRTFLANSGIGGKGGPGGAPGGLIATPPEMMAPKEVAALAENTAFAKTKAPFTEARPLIGPEGTLWVERSMPRGSPSRWDVFDGQGRLTTQVELPVGRRLVGLGKASVYLVSVDADGVERLERHRP